MGFLTGLKAGGQYLAFRTEVSKVYVAILNENPGIENFQIALGTWKSVLDEFKRPTLANSGEHVVKYYALGNRVESAEYLTRHLAQNLIPNFGETRLSREHEELLRDMLASQAIDGGARFNAIFKQVNPKSYELFVTLMGGPPFSPRTFL